MKSCRLSLIFPSNLTMNTQCRYHALGTFQLFEISCRGGCGPVGALSYLTVAALGLALTPLPFVLKKITEASSSEKGGSNAAGGEQREVQLKAT